jgi:hypothetical protein
MAKMVASIVSGGITPWRAARSRYSRHTTIDQLIVHHLEQPYLLMTHLLYQFLRTPACVMHVYRPERIDGNRTG